MKNLKKNEKTQLYKGIDVRNRELFTINCTRKETNIGVKFQDVESIGPRMVEDVQTQAFRIQIKDQWYIISICLDNGKQIIYEAIDETGAWAIYNKDILNVIISELNKDHRTRLVLLSI